MMEKHKKGLSFVLAAALVIALFPPGTALAAEEVGGGVNRNNYVPCFLRH